jgi:hypothetical protein
VTAPVRKSDIKLDPVVVFTARAQARALLWHCHEFDLHEAIDVLQRDAERTGLLAAIGQDLVQEILSEAFKMVRP